MRLPRVWSGLALLLVLITPVNVVSEPLRVGVLGAIHHPEKTYAAYLIDMALARHGYQLELVSVPGKRLMSQLNRGEVDGDLFRSVDLSRGFESVLRIPESVGSTCGSVYRLKIHESFDIGRAMHDVSIAAYHGAPGASSFFLRQWPAANFEFFSSLPQGFKMLSHERVDLIAIHDLDERYLQALSERPIARYARFNLEANYFHLHRKYVALVQPLTETLKALKQQYPPPLCLEGGEPVAAGTLIYSQRTSHREQGESGD